MEPDGEQNPRHPLEVSASLTAHELKQELDALDGRDLYLWSIALLVVVILAAGFLSIVVPEWRTGTLEVAARYVPQLIFGFVVLVILVNIYLLEQRLQLKRSRLQLIQQLVRSEAAELTAQIDPLTETFNRRCLEPVLTKEIGRVERKRSPLSVVMIDLDDFRAVNNQLGHAAGDKVLKAAVDIMRNTLRASDTIVRYGGDEFVLVLPDTNLEQAECAIGRLLRNIDIWNRSGEIRGVTLGMSHGVAEYRKGITPEELVDEADRRMYEVKKQEA